MHLAEAGFYRPRWTDRIVAEMRRAGLRRKLSTGYLDRVESKLREAFPEALVLSYEPYEAAFAVLPDQDDRHVVAAAIKCDAAVIVTENLRDFPSLVLDPINIEAMTADAFIADLIDLDQSHAARAIELMRRGFKRPEYSMEDLLRRMDEIGLRQSASLLAGAV